MGTKLEFKKPSPSTSWTTSDGRKFSSKEDADQHQAIIDFEVWYKDNCPKDTKTASMLLWLRENGETLDGMLTAFRMARRC
jgi:hypothetical protein